MPTISELVIRYNLLKTLAITLGFLSLATFSVKTAAQEKKVTMAIGEWRPSTSKDLPGYGRDSQIVTAAYAEMGVTVEYEFYPWARAYEEARKGRVDGSFPWVKSIERMNSFIYSDPIIVGDGKYVFFYLKDSSFDWETLKDLKGLTIGVHPDYYYGENFDEALKKKLFKIDHSYKDALLFKMLLGKRFPVVIFEKSAGEAFIKKDLTPEEAQKITSHPKIVEYVDGHLIMKKDSPNSKKNIELFNTGLSKIHKNGIFDKIVNNFN